MRIKFLSALNRICRIVSYRVVSYMYEWVMERSIICNLARTVPVMDLKRIRRNLLYIYLKKGTKNINNTEDLL